VRLTLVEVVEVELFLDVEVGGEEGFVARVVLLYERTGSEGEGSCARRWCALALVAGGVVAVRGAGSSIVR
jgi:hypothetical protein